MNSTVKIRTSVVDAERVRAAWRSERRRLRRLVEDRMRRHLAAEGWPTGPDAEHVDVPPAELRRRRKVRREFVAAVVAGGVRPTAEALLEDALVAAQGGGDAADGAEIHRDDWHVWGVRDGQQSGLGRGSRGHAPTVTAPERISGAVTGFEVIPDRDGTPPTGR